MKRKLSSMLTVVMILSLCLQFPAVQTVYGADSAPKIDADTITFTNPTDDSVSVSWAEASATVSEATYLEYKVVYSLKPNINTVIDAENNGTIAKDWTKDLTSATVTGLTRNSTYYFNVLVQDNLKNKNVYAMEKQNTLRGALAEFGGENETELFLGGNYIELGISNWGDFGTLGNKPDGFRGTSYTQIGMSADHDGYNNGNDLPVDYYLPGTPEERFAVGYSVEGKKYTNTNSAQMHDENMPTVVTDQSITKDGLLQAKAVSTWKDCMEITQVISFNVNDKFYRNDVTIKNLTDKTWDGSRYMRSFDPDNTVFQGGEYTTNNTVTYTIGEDNKAVVKAETINDYDSLYEAFKTRAPIFFYSINNAAVASTFGFTNKDPYAAAAYDDPSPKNKTVKADQAISITWDSGKLKSGDSKRFTYYTSLDERDFSNVQGEIVTADIVNDIKHIDDMDDVKNIKDKIDHQDVLSKDKKEAFKGDVIDTLYKSPAKDVTFRDDKDILVMGDIINESDKSDDEKDDTRVKVIKKVVKDLGKLTKEETSAVDKIVSDITDEATRKEMKKLTEVHLGVPQLKSAVGGDQHVEIMWNSVADAAGYKIYKSTASGSYGDPIATVTDAVYKYDITGLTNGTPYYFVVKAKNDKEESEYSNEISATPKGLAEDAPKLDWPEVGDTHAKIVWKPVEGAKGYKIYKSTESGTYTPVTVEEAVYDYNVTDAVYSFTYKGLTNDKICHFVVKVVKSDGSDSDYSNEVSVVPQVLVYNVFNENKVILSDEDSVIDINGTGNKKDTIWIAPIGTKEFKETDTMYKVPGDSKKIKVPSEDGQYKIYVVDQWGNVSEPSYGRVTVDKTSPRVEGVQDNQLYNRARKITFNEGTATLNGEAFASGDKVEKNGDYTLVVTDKYGHVTTVKFTIKKNPMDGENIQIGYKDGDSAEGVTTDVTLPTTGLKGDPITWKSSNLAIMGNDGVIKSLPKTDTYITLTATITKEGETATKDFRIRVLKKEDTGTTVITDKEKVDDTKLQEAIDAAQAQKKTEVTIKVRQEVTTNNPITISISKKEIDDAKNKKINLIFKTNNTSIKVPIASVDTSDMDGNSRLQLVCKQVDTQASENKEMVEAVKKINEAMGIYKQKIFDFSMIKVEEDESGKKISEKVIHFTSDKDITLGILVGSVESNNALMTFYYNPDTKVWEYVRGRYQQASGEIEIATKHLSTYSVMTLTPDQKREELTKLINDPDISVPVVRYILEDDDMKSALDKMDKYNDFNDYYKNQTAKGIIDGKKTREKNQYKDYNDLKKEFSAVVDKVYSRSQDDDDSDNPSDSTSSNTEKNNKEVTPKTENTSSVQILKGENDITVKEISNEEISNEALTPKDKDMKLISDVYTVSGKKNTNTLEGQIQITYDQSKVANEDHLAVFVYDSKDNQWHCIGGVVDKDQNTVTVNINKEGKIAVMELTKTFKDVKGHWAQDIIEILAARQIITGDGQGNFNPNMGITRAEFATLISKMLHLPLSGTDTGFTDVAPDDWFAPYSTAARKAGIIKGVSETEYEPDRIVNREEMTAIVMRAYKYANGTAITDEEINKEAEFVDSGKIGDWAYKNVYAAKYLKLIQGRDKNTFMPQSETTKAEAAVLAYRLLKVLNEI